MFAFDNIKTIIIKIIKIIKISKTYHSLEFERRTNVRFKSKIRKYRHILGVLRVIADRSVY